MSEGRAEGNDESSRTPVGNQTGGCVNCSRPVTFDNFVQCDQCDSWWHMLCAGVTESVADRAWTCRNCVPLSVTSKSSGKSARIALKLQKLEEERAIQQRILEAERRAIEQDRKLMQEKYNLLEEQLEEDRENASVRSRVSQRSNDQRVKLWVDNHAMEGAVGGVPAEGTPAEGTSTAEKPTAEASAKETPTVGVSTVGEPIATSSVVGATSAMQQSARASTTDQNLMQQIQRMNLLSNQAYFEGIQQQRKGAIPKTTPKVRERTVEDHVRKQESNRIPSAPPVIPPGKPPLNSTMNKGVAQPSRNYYDDMLARLAWDFIRL